MTMSRLAGMLPVVFACQSALALSPAFDISTFHIEGATLVDAARLQAVAAPFAGAGKGMDGIHAATAAIRETYAQAGYPIVQVYAPSQELRGGTVTLRVVEGKVAKIAVAGQRTYTENNVRASLPPLRVGDKPNTNAVAAAVLLANDNPARQLSVNFSPGSAPGEVDARIDVAEDKVSKTTVTLDNAGSRTTGRARMALGYQHANLFERDHVLNLQAMAGLQHPGKGSSLTAAYRMPFYQQRLALDVIAAYSDSKSDTTSIAGPLFFSGKGVYAGMRLNQPLPSRGDYRQKLVYGIDYKDFNNSCRIGAIVLDRCGTITSVPLSVTYLGQAVGARFQAGASLGYYRNIPGGSHGGQTEYGARPRSWQALRGSAFVGVATGEWQWRATINGQASSDALIPSEQFGIGGAASVRGYDERTAAGDKGVAASLELYTPELFMARAAGGQAGRHALRLLAFYDTGHVHNGDGTPPAAKHLSSFGTGLRYGFGKEVALRCDVGLAQTAVGTGGPSAREHHDAFAHVNFVYSF